VIILGCTEPGILITAEGSPVPLIDTTVVHAQAAVGWPFATPPLAAE
jgi:aspartate racemase